MNREDIIRMAREAGFVDYELDDGTTESFDKRYERFAALVASAERESLRESFRVVTAAEASAAILHEREACAKVCEGINSAEDYYGERPELVCAEAIRAKGQA